MEGKPNLDYNTLKLKLGTYVQLYEGTNSMQVSRSVGAIALNPSNETGGYHFMSLKTGKKLHGHIWTKLPISDSVIERVEELGEAMDNHSWHQGLFLNGHQEILL